MDRQRQRLDLVSASLWGFAEATLFFIVPDVLLSFLALDSRRRALLACIWVVGRAVLGGSLMYACGAHDRAGSADVLQRIPAVDAAMIDKVGRDMKNHGFVAIFAGAFTGKPYKIYAVQAGALGVGVLPFLAVFWILFYTGFFMLMPD